MISIWEALQYCPQPSAPREAGTAGQSTHLELTLRKWPKQRVASTPVRLLTLPLRLITSRFSPCLPWITSMVAYMSCSKGESQVQSIMRGSTCQGCCNPPSQ